MLDKLLEKVFISNCRCQYPLDHFKTKEWTMFRMFLKLFFTNVTAGYATNYYLFNQCFFFKLKKKQMPLGISLNKYFINWQPDNWEKCDNFLTRGKSISEQPCCARFFTELENPALFSVATSLGRKKRDFQTP